MSKRIQLLPAMVANQIAAGEVVERPASVVKELLENALDAGADTISVDIGFGGLNQIKISDNGVGIMADDLPLAIAAHATSKITRVTDLYAIDTMGFRGEALASIAAVSRIAIYSKPAIQAHAMCLSFDGERVDITPCARTNGTTIDVRDLFFNAPIRKKFLKTEAREFQAIETVVKRFALGSPHMALVLKHNDRVILSLPKAQDQASRELRIKKILGAPFLSKSIYLDVERAGMHLQGWVSGPDYQRSQNDKQWIYINQRMVKDKLMHHAIKQAYDGSLHPGRFPSCLLYLRMPSTDVDVNVHPTKYEVRFQQPRLLHDFIVSQVREAASLLTCKPMAKPISVRVEETYVKKPLRAAMEGTMTTGDDWVILHAGYAFVWVEKKPYLVDASLLKKQYMACRLQAEPMPLASRRLLVPIQYSVSQSNAAFFEKNQALFEQIGVQLAWVSETVLLIRSVPLLLPQLAIKPWLDALRLHGIETETEALQCAIDCQTIDAFQLSQEEKQTLGAYIAENAHHLQGCMELSPQQCQALLHV